MRVALVGATGAVGREMLRLLEASPLPVDRCLAYGTARSEGTELTFRDQVLRCRELSEKTFSPVDLVLASAGSGPSLLWSPRFVDSGAVVVDNSSAFRRDETIPLVVPEINGHALVAGTSIVANPNCSTIQMVMALAPLHAAWELASVHVATYQSVSGAGARASEELRRESARELRGESPAHEVFPHPMAFEALPHIGEFDDQGESLEETKMRLETRRILELPALAVGAHCVRVPVFRGHSEAVWAGFRRMPDPEEARALLRQAPGVAVIDDPQRGRYPLAREAAGRPEVFVGRVRRDPAVERGLCLWVVSDNLLKGAALNAVQIAEFMAGKGLLPREGS